MESDLCHTIDHRTEGLNNRVHYTSMLTVHHYDVIIFDDVSNIMGNGWGRMS